MEYNEGVNRILVRDDIDWSQSRVVFVSTDFTENQKEATNFKDPAIELWEIKRFENDVVAITPIRKSKSADSIRPITQRTAELSVIAKEIKVYTEEDHLLNKQEGTIELYEKFKSAILNLASGIEVKPQKFYIAFKKDGKNIADIELLKMSLKLFINVRRGFLNDPKCIMRDISGVWHLGNGDYEIKTADDADLEYIMSLVKQAIEK